MSFSVENARRDPYGRLHKAAYSGPGDEPLRPEGSHARPADPAMAARFAAYQQQPLENRVVPVEDRATNSAMMGKLLRYVAGNFPEHAKAVATTPLRNGPQKITPTEWKQQGLYVTCAHVEQLLENLYTSQFHATYDKAPAPWPILPGSQNDWTEDEEKRL